MNTPYRPAIHQEHGWSLPELLVAIVVMGILLSAALYVANGVKRSGFDKDAQIAVRTAERLASQSASKNAGRTFQVWNAAQARYEPEAPAFNVSAPNYTVVRGRPDSTRTPPLAVDPNGQLIQDRHLFDNIALNRLDNAYSETGPSASSTASSSSKPRQVFVQTDAPTAQSITLCSASKSGRIYCIHRSVGSQPFYKVSPAGTSFAAAASWSGTPSSPDPSWRTAPW